MVEFQFDENIINRVVELLDAAEEYIKIAIFQIHNHSIFEVLNRKLQGGIAVSIFTLPFDSINEAGRQDVEQRLRELQNNGAELLFCRWNVGDPERTTTAVGRWYSFHGKFIVTDKNAISLSANLIQAAELDAMLIYDDAAKIQEFNEKFDELKDLFITAYGNYDGSIRQKITATPHANINAVFQLPRVISPGTHDNHWIKEYPPELCPENTHVEDKLYITPFDCRGRNFLQDIIEDAEEFVFISAESFTDKEFPNFLKKIKLKGVDIKILTGDKSMDFSDRIQIFMKELLGYGIELKTTTKNLHAKVCITDKLVAISSINLNNMNLGFRRTGGFWRENTETVNICSNPTIITAARTRFLAILGEAETSDIKDKFADKNKGKIGKYFTKVFNTRSTNDAKLFLSKLSIEKEVEKEAYILDVIKKAVEIANTAQSNSVTETHLRRAVEEVD